MLKAFKNIILLLRPHQWLKNLLLLFPPFFAGRMHEKAVLEAATLSLLAFSLVASCGYIINDIKDRDSDRRHSSKKNRPIARGHIPVSLALVIAGMLYIGSMIVATFVPGKFQAYIVIYLLLSLTYTIYFKNIVIADIFIVSFGFLLRVLAGGEAFQVVVSSWLFLTVFIVALFLATGKRLGEIVSLGNVASMQRKILADYQPAYLEGVMWFCSAAAVVMYALYSIENRPNLIYTVPVVAFGLLRYIYIVRNGKGDPTEALLRDNQIMATGVVWFLMISIVIYK